MKMRTGVFPLLASLLLVAHLPSPVVAATPLAREGIERVIKATGRDILERNVRNSAEKAATQAIRHFGVEGAEDLVKKGGLPLLQAAARHGDEVWSLLRRVPEAATHIGARPEQALALVHRYGDDALRLEVRLPGMAESAVGKFGPQSLATLNRAPTSEVLRLLGYAGKADTPATRQALWDKWRERGGQVLDELDKRRGLILTGGLTLAMVQTADNIPTEDLGKAAQTVASGVSTAVMLASGILALALAVALLRRRAIRKA